MNILFIMCDQLRWDYLSCYGHPHLQTPNIDRLAERGVRFERAYVQSAICGPSRACIYTGRYVSSHGASMNSCPLPPSERFLGDYLAEVGTRTVLIGKSHIELDLESLQLLGIDPSEAAGQRAAEGAFEPYWRDDGLHPNDKRAEEAVYNQYLRSLGYTGQNPWHTHANGAIDADGNFCSGWFNQNARLPANIQEEHSETPYATTRAIEFMENAGEKPWCLHLSYIKPHWPYIAPAPYHALYGVDEIIPPNRCESERDNPHPVLAAYQQNVPSRGFSQDKMRETVIPTYMGLIKQIDDQIGRLLNYLETTDQLKNTFIVLTSDHGDYLGDHWLGDKNFFHEEIVRIPLIIVDPRCEGDATRGTVNRHLVESIDLVPTFVEVMGGVPSYRLDGRSLLPLIHGKQTTWRNVVISEFDYADRQGNYILNLPPAQCRAVMIRTEQWKYIAFNGFRPMLFDLVNDPQERHDLGASPAYAVVRQEMQAHLADWTVRRNPRLAISDALIESDTWQYGREREGIYLGYWSEADLPDKIRPR